MGCGSLGVWGEVIGGGTGGQGALSPPPPSRFEGGGLECPIRHTSGISGGFRQLRKYDSAVMANFGTFCDAARMNTGVNRQAEGRHSAR